MWSSSVKQNGTDNISQVKKQMNSNDRYQINRLSMDSRKLGKYDQRHDPSITKRVILLEDDGISSECVLCDYFTKINQMKR
jgi:hypothetical protein